MPETVRLFRVLLAAPSDVTEEHELVGGVSHGSATPSRARNENPIPPPDQGEVRWGHLVGFPFSQQQLLMGLRPGPVRMKIC
jgi:hypothetical protein